MKRSGFVRENRGRYKVCHVSTVHPERDVRIFYKECSALAGAGYDVHLVVTAGGNRVINNIKVIALPEVKGRVQRIFIKSLIALYKSLKVNSHVYHLHDPELLPVGLILKLCGKKVIYDIHELIFYQIPEKSWLPRYLAGIIDFVYKIVEFVVVKTFDHIVLVVEPQLDYFKKNYRIVEGKITIVKNYPILQKIDQIKVARKEGKCCLIYAGVLARERGIKEIVQAMGSIGDSAQLWLVGRWVDDRYKDECMELDGWKYVRYFGQRSLDETLKLMKMADIGLAVLLPIKNNIGGLPTKVFDYMACGLPVVISNFHYWRKVFSGCALFVDPNNVENIAEKLETLIKDEGLRRRLGLAGRRAVQEKYCWETERLKLIKIYDCIFGIR